MRTGICIVGAGPAGLMAAIHAAQTGAPTTVVEANAKAGRKLLLTGGGRCNVTHAGRPEEIAHAFGNAGRFLRHALHEFPPNEVLNFLLTRGLASRVEPDDCVFPATDRADDVLGALLREIEGSGTGVVYGSRVTELAIGDNGFIVQTERQRILAARVIVATGGLSWPQTGSTGDGYRFAARLGHTVVTPRPALIPLVTREPWPRELAGVSLPSVKITALVAGRRVTATGNMLFTHAGMGGPAVLDLSRLLVDELARTDHGVGLHVDIAPRTNPAEFDGQLQQSIRDHPRKTMVNVLAEFMPRQLARALCRLAPCDGDAQGNQLPAPTRRRLVTLVKGVPLCVTGTEPIARATVTHGGVSTQQIDPKTMESRIRPGLFFAGEVIDADGPCGGYNLQMCWSTGALAGRAAARAVLAPCRPTQ